MTLSLVCPLATTARRACPLGRGGRPTPQPGRRIPVAVNAPPLLRPPPGRRASPCPRRPTCLSAAPLAGSSLPPPAPARCPPPPPPPRVRNVAKLNKPKTTKTRKPFNNQKASGTRAATGRMLAPPPSRCRSGPRFPRSSLPPFSGSPSPLSSEKRATAALPPSGAATDAFASPGTGHHRRCRRRLSPLSAAAVDAVPPQPRRRRHGVRDVVKQTTAALPPSGAATDAFASPATGHHRRCRRRLSPLSAAAVDAVPPCTTLGTAGHCRLLDDGPSVVSFLRAGASARQRKPTGRRCYAINRGRCDGVTLPKGRHI